MLSWIRDALMSIINRGSTDPQRPDSSRVSEITRVAAGVIVTPDTAIKNATVWACLRYLSQTTGVLPWHVMRDGPNGASIARSHPVDFLIAVRPNDEWSSFQFRETLLHWALRWGNGYAEIERDELDRPFALWPIHPERVRVCRAVEPEVSNTGREIPVGAMYYEVNNGADGRTDIAARDMFHLRGFGEGPVGVNVIHYAAESLGWAQAMQLFGAAFFGNGATPSTIVINKKPLTPDGLTRQKAEFAALYQGPRRSHKTAHLDLDADIKTVGVNARDSQLIESNQHLVEEICRWFGVPPHKVGHLLRAHFNNIEHQSIEVVVDSVSPWIKRFEDEADFKLFGPRSRGFYTKMNMRALMRGDNAARVQFYKGMWEMGAYSPNRILELEDENTLGPDGDKHLVQLNLTTLEQAGEQPAAGPSVAPSEEEDTGEDNPATIARLDRLEELIREPAHAE